jgi:hypothetical protein
MAWVNSDVASWLITAATEFFSIISSARRLICPLENQRARVRVAERPFGQPAHHFVALAHLPDDVVHGHVDVQLCTVAGPPRGRK